MDKINSSKKENKNAYKQMKFRMGIFQIKNLEDKKLFLQTSTDLDRAYNGDKFQLNMGLHSNKELQNDWTILGPEKFEFSILDELNLIEPLTEMEIKKELKELLELHRSELSEKEISLY